MHKTILKTVVFVKEYAVPFTGIVFAVLNIYLSTKLNPIISDIKDIVHRVQAVEVRTLGVENECTEIKKDIFEELKYLRGRVDNIYQIVK
jgi:hypothetical protein